MAAPRANELREACKNSTAELEIQPSLVGYFNGKHASTTAFFKAVKQKNVRRFPSADRRDALNTMAMQDPQCERLWALMSRRSSIPEAVDAWIWEAAQSRLNEHLGESFDPQCHDATRVFESILNKLFPDLRSSQKERKKCAHIMLQMAVCWLVEKRSLNVWKIADHLRQVYFSDSKTALQKAKSTVQKGNERELKLAAAMTGLGSQIVKDAEDDRNRQWRISNDLRERLDRAQNKTERLNSDLEDSKNRIAGLEAKTAELELTIAAERQHRDHDLTEIKAGHQLLLAKRLSPILRDAVDALEIEPQAPGTALRRVKSALKEIERQRNE